MHGAHAVQSLTGMGYVDREKDRTVSSRNMLLQQPSADSSRNPSSGISSARNTSVLNWSKSVSGSGFDRRWRFWTGVSGASARSHSACLEPDRFIGAE